MSTVDILQDTNASTLDLRALENENSNDYQTNHALQAALDEGATDLRLSLDETMCFPDYEASVVVVFRALKRLGITTIRL